MESSSLSCSSSSSPMTTPGPNNISSNGPAEFGASLSSSALLEIITNLIRKQYQASMSEQQNNNNALSWLLANSANQSDVIKNYNIYLTYWNWLAQHQQQNTISNLIHNSQSYQNGELFSFFFVLI